MKNGLLEIAYEYGATAYANGRRQTLSKIDRSDLAFYYKYRAKWQDIPEEDQNALVDAFNKGVEAEKKEKGVRAM